jgi:hypothetical protein
MMITEMKSLAMTMPMMLNSSSCYQRKILSSDLTTIMNQPALLPLKAVCFYYVAGVRQRGLASWSLNGLVDWNKVHMKREDSS